MSRVENGRLDLADNSSDDPIRRLAKPTPSFPARPRRVRPSGFRSPRTRSPKVNAVSFFPYVTARLHPWEPGVNNESLPADCASGGEAGIGVPVRLRALLAAARLLIQTYRRSQDLTKPVPGLPWKASHDNRGPEDCREAAASTLELAIRGAGGAAPGLRRCTQQNKV